MLSNPTERSKDPLAFNSVYNSVVVGERRLRSAYLGRSGRLHEMHGSGSDHRGASASVVQQSCLLVNDDVARHTRLAVRMCSLELFPPRHESISYPLVDDWPILSERRFKYMPGSDWPLPRRLCRSGRARASRRPCEALGNFPQVFGHLALISAGFNLDEKLGITHYFAGA